MKQLDNLSIENITVLAETFRLLGDATRLKIMFCCLDTEMPVGEIASKLDVSQTLVSHHLRLLRAARLVKSDRVGKQVFYTLEDCHVRDILIDMATHINEETHD